MDFTTVNLTEVSYDWQEIRNVPGAELVPILYQNKPLSLILTEETKIEVKHLYHRVEQLTEVEGQFFLQTVAQDTGKWVAVCSVSGAFQKFLQNLYIQLARQLETRDQEHDLIKHWYYGEHAPVYGDLNHLLQWKKDGTCYFTLPVENKDAQPNILQLKNLCISTRGCKLKCVTN